VLLESIDPIKNLPLVSNFGSCDLSSGYEYNSGCRWLNSDEIWNKYWKLEIYSKLHCLSQKLRLKKIWGDMMAPKFNSPSIENIKEVITSTPVVKSKHIDFLSKKFYDSLNVSKFVKTLSFALDKMLFKYYVVQNSHVGSSVCTSELNLFDLHSVEIIVLANELQGIAANIDISSKSISMRVLRNFHRNRNEEKLLPVESVLLDTFLSVLIVVDITE